MVMNNIFSYFKTPSMTKTSVRNSFQMNDVFDVHFVMTNKEVPFQSGNIVHKWRETNVSYNYEV